MAAAATLSAHPAPCSGQPRGASLQKPELGFLPHSGQQLPGPLSAPESPLRSPGSGLVVCVRASVCVSECGSARARVAGDPRGPRRREARAGDGSSLWALRCGASSSPGVQLPISRRESGERLATLVHSTGKAELLGRASAAVASEEEEEEGRGAPTPT